MTSIDFEQEDVRTTIEISKEGIEPGLFIQLQEVWVSGIDSRNEVISTRLPREEMVKLRDMINAALEDEPWPETTR